MVELCHGTVVKERAQYFSKIHLDNNQYRMNVLSNTLSNTGSNALRYATNLAMPGTEFMIGKDIHGVCTRPSTRPALRSRASRWALLPRRL